MSNPNWSENLVPNSVLNNDSMSERKNTDSKETNALKKCCRINAPGAKLMPIIQIRGTFCSDCSNHNSLTSKLFECHTEDFIYRCKSWNHLVHSLLLFLMVCLTDSFYNLQHHKNSIAFIEYVMNTEGFHPKNAEN